MYTTKNYDIVTGFPHRTTFMQSFDIYQCTYDRNIIMLVCINELQFICHGPDYIYGNDLLREFANRLRETGTNSICRYTYNEFLIITDHFHSYIELYTYVHHLIKKCTAPIYISDKKFTITVNIGISLFPDHSTNLVDLIYKADMALSQSYVQGTNRFYLFNFDSMYESSRSYQIQNALQTALSNNELYVVFQPKICAKEDRIVGLESLVRWQHPTLGNVSPYEFISLAENNGLIAPIGLFVFEQSCKRCRELIDLGYKDIKISISVSKVQLQDINIVNNFMHILNIYNVPPHYIELEITENILAYVPEKNINVLQSFKSAGISIALDDFGTGSASFQYLKSLPVDTLKIDKSFISDIGSNPRAEHIIQCMIDMSHQLNISVVAEGVETLTHINFLKKLTCDTFQGFFYSKPVPFDQIIHMLPQESN